MVLSMDKPEMTPERIASLENAIKSITDLIELEEQRLQLLRQMKKGLEQQRVTSHKRR